MAKRAVTVFIALMLVFVGVGVRTASLCLTAEQVAGTTAAMSVDLATLRGTIYDCEMHKLTNGGYELYAAAKPTEAALAQLKECLSAQVFESVMQRMSKGKPVAVRVERLIDECADITPIFVPKRYSSDDLAGHLIGYLNASGEGVSGVEKAFDEILARQISEVRVRFPASAQGRVMLGEDIIVTGNSAPKQGIILTIDGEIQRITEQELDSSGAECAAAVVIDIESGAIRASVSRPIFDRDDIEKSLEDENSPMINRAFLPFSVGSVFKPIIACAALDRGISGDFEYNCTGSVVHNGVTFNCHKKDGHGVLDMQGAVANSCNTYFIALGIEVGGNEIIETAKSFGFGRGIQLTDGIRCSAGSLPTSDQLDSKAAIANISFGQGSLLATPVQICAMMAAIAAGGIYKTPYLIEGEADEGGNIIRYRRYDEQRQIVPSATADVIKKYLEQVVKNGSGSRAQSDLTACAGKTATAQTGRFDENGEEIYNAWFAGYFPADNPKYAVAILKENGGEGAVSCAPVFKNIAERITVAERLSQS